MIISIGCTAFILTMIMFTQFKTVEKTDITAIETMREAELRTELADWKVKYEEIETRLTDAEAKVNEYQSQLANNAESSKILENEVADAEKYLGYTNLHCEGIVITLQDNDMYNIEYTDLLNLVNELNIAGAEAISINEERVVSMTDIVLINNRIVLVNGKRISGPYEVKAIGDKKYLESAITIKGGYKDRTEAEGKTISYTSENNIIIPAYQGNLTLEYAEVVKDEN